MLESVNFLAGRGHEVHAFAGSWDVPAIHEGVIRHNLSFPRSPQVLALPAYKRASARAIASMQIPPDVVAGFGAAVPIGAVTWMQSVHAAWIDIAQRTRNLPGRTRQRVNPFHGVALRMEESLLRGGRYGRIIALTPQVRDDIIAYYGVPNEDIDVLPNGFSRTEFHPAQSAERQRVRDSLGVSEGDRVVIFVANELERKGFQLLVQALSRRNDPSLKLLAVGGYSQNEALRIVQQYGIGDRAILRGSTNDIAKFYAAADLFALPTKYEAWGLVVIEAIAAGLPALVSADAGAAVAVQDGVNGVRVPDPTSLGDVEDALEMLLETSFDISVVATSVDNYEWGNLLVRYEEILQSAST